MSKRLKRYDKTKRGSFQISLDLYDWELSVVIGALRAARKDHEKLDKPSKGYLTYLKRLEAKFSKALGDVLKAEFRDLKLSETKPLVEEFMKNS